MNFSKVSSPNWPNSPNAPVPTETNSPELRLELQMSSLNLREQTMAIETSQTRSKTNGKLNSNTLHCTQITNLDALIERIFTETWLFVLQVFIPPLFCLIN